MKVLNLGSLHVDYNYSLQHIINANETQAASKMQIFSGGKGLNQSISMARAGLKVYHAGCIGDDGDSLIEKLNNAGVDTSLVRKIEGQRSGHAIIQVDTMGQNAIIVCGGTNYQVSEEYIDEILENFDEGDIIVLQNEISNVGYAVDKAYEKNMTVIFNPSPCDERIKEIDLTKVSVFFINETEGKALTGFVQPGDILIAMKQRYPHSKCVMTLGNKGAFYQDENGNAYYPAIKCNPVDSTGAGDIFEGYFIAAYQNEHNTSKALKIASYAAGISVCRHGGSESAPAMEEVFDRMTFNA